MNSTIEKTGMEARLTATPQVPAAATERRRRAEERLKRRPTEGGGRRAEGEMAKLVHELEVHQVELEMQNEELQQSRAKAEELVRELQTAMSKVKMLTGLLPICASCKKIRNGQGYWKQIESYIESHSEATFTHGMCPECLAVFVEEVDAVNAQAPVIQPASRSGYGQVNCVSRSFSSTQSGAG